MAFRLAHLSSLLTCLLLITGTAMTRKMEDPGMVVDTRGGGGGAEEDGVGGGAAEDGVGGGGAPGEAVNLGVVVVENGTEEEVILDCPYHLDEEDLQGIRIAWYHERYDGPVYQWIPNYDPQAILLLKDRVDLTYEASSEPLQRYRALRILNPTTELTGRYQCLVSSFSKEVKYQQKLIVFKEPTAVNVHVEVVEDGLLSVNCSVEEMYPQPLLHLYQKSHSKPGVKLEGGTLVTSTSDQTYSMELDNTVDEGTLDGTTEFECRALIPDTDISIANTTTYQPKITFTTSPVIGGSNRNQQSHLLLLLAISIAVCLVNN